MLSTNRVKRLLNRKYKTIATLTNSGSNRWGYLYQQILRLEMTFHTRGEDGREAMQARRDSAHGLAPGGLLI